MKKGRRASTSRIAFAKLTVGISTRPKTLKALKASLVPETSVGKRSKMTLRLRKTGLSMITNASDLVSLRAAFNTNLRLASSSLKSIRSADSVLETYRKTEKSRIDPSRTELPNEQSK